MAFKKILVALDHSPQASFVFEQALAQMHLQGSHLMIVHVIRPESDIQTAPYLGIGTIADVDTYGTMKRLQRERMQREVEQAKVWLDDYYQQAIARGAIAEVDCRVAEPAVWICDLALNWKANVIVLGRRGRQGLAEVMLGSVSNYVLHHAPCSVLVVQGSDSASQSADLDVAL